MTEAKRAGHAVIGLDPARSQWTDYIGSVTDKRLINDLFQEHEFDAVLHAGALHKPDILRYPQQAFIDVNITGTLNLLEASCERPGTRFVFTSTTSLMISQAIREAKSDVAIWLDEDAHPLQPRNIYGVTKLAGEGLCRQHHIERGLSVIVLRTARFFPEDDDMLDRLSGPNLKANELLNRRATVEDMARAHLIALEQAPKIGFGLYIVSAPTPFSKSDCTELKRNASGVISRLYPDAEALYAKRGWQLPQSLSRVYDGSLIMRDLGFQYTAQFQDVLHALRTGEPSPVQHDASYTSPLLANG